MSRSTVMSTHGTSSARRSAAALASAPLIVHCHLRWDFVWQRPQQIMTRLSVSHPILFLEEPMPGEGTPRIELTQVHPGIVRAVPIIPASTGWTTDEQYAATLPLLKAVIANHPLLAGRFDRPIQWFYSPMSSLCFLGELNEIGVVYDCMDELSNFRFAPADLSQREQMLLADADIVFTGGHRLYEAKSRQHGNTHFYGCGVDSEHFGKARLAETQVPQDIANLKKPVFGYFGVIDERLDYALLEQLAVAYPEGSVAMVGPVVKVEASSLPRLPDIHWFGQRAYADLPSIVKGFDVCLMPFAMNDATRFINPTKTLEYMAAGKPIVSTAVPDVVRHFRPVVQVAASPDEFVTLVGKALYEDNSARIEQGLGWALDASWDVIVAKMDANMCAAMNTSRHTAANISSTVAPAVAPAQRGHATAPVGLVASGQSRSASDKVAQ